MTPCSIRAGRSADSGNGRHWDEINTEVPCPIRFTNEELRAHDRDGAGWNETAEFWASLEGFANRDGWTTHENFEAALDLFSQLRDQGLHSLDDDERSEFEKQTRWAARKSLGTP